MVPPFVAVAAHVAVEHHPRYPPRVIVAPFEALDDDQSGDRHADPAPPEPRPPGSVRPPHGWLLAASNAPSPIPHDRWRDNDRRPPRSGANNRRTEGDPRNTRTTSGRRCDRWPSLRRERGSRSGEGRSGRTSRSASDRASRPAAATSGPTAALARPGSRYLHGRGDHQRGSQHNPRGRANDRCDTKHRCFPTSEVPSRSLRRDVSATLHFGPRWQHDRGQTPAPGPNPLATRLDVSYLPSWTFRGHRRTA